MRLFFHVKIKPAVWRAKGSDKNIMNETITDYNIIPEIKQRIPIDQIFYQCFPNHNVIRKGSKSWSCCPFHTEKTPSFYMDTLNNRFYCFSCHASGDTIDLYGKANNLDTNQSIKTLADQLGIFRGPSLQAKDTINQAVQQRRQENQRVLIARTIIKEEYQRLCNLERAIYRVLNSIKIESDLNRPEVIEALKAKDKINYWLDSWQYADEAGRLEIALSVRGIAI